MLAQRSFLTAETPSESDCCVLECVHMLLSLLTLAVIDHGACVPAVPLTGRLASHKQLTDGPQRLDLMEIVCSLALSLRLILI